MAGFRFSSAAQRMGRIRSGAKLAAREGPTPLEDTSSRDPSLVDSGMTDGGLPPMARPPRVSMPRMAPRGFGRRSSRY